MSDKLTIREAARKRVSLGGPDAQALEGALQQAERELSAAQATIKRLEGEISDTPRKLGLSVIEQLSLLTDAQRLGIFGLFCTHCGCDDPRCQCWNDE